MEATALSSPAPLPLQLRFSASSRAPSVSRIALVSSHFVRVRCSVSSRSWRRIATGSFRARAVAGEEEEKPAQGEEKEEGEKEKVDYRLYQALMRGGEEVISVLKEMTELVSAFFLSLSPLMVFI